MTNKQVVRGNFLILFLFVAVLFPSASFSKITTEPSIEIVQQQNVYDILIIPPKNFYISDETLDVTIIGKRATLESIFYENSENFEDHDVFWNSSKIKAIVRGEDKSDFKIVIDYQSCSKKHECSEVLSYEQDFKLLLPVVEKTIETDVTNEDEAVTEQDGIVNMLKDKSLIFTILTFFSFGLLLAFTPCMLPVIPILSAVILCKQENMTAKRGFLLSLTYVLSMSFVYAIAGVLAASLGSSIQAFFQEPWIIILFSIFFFILSLGMFGTFNIEMPKKLQSFLTAKSVCSTHRTYFSIVLLGILSALIIGPCVAPPLAGALIYISQTGNELIGGLSLFVMSLGMGLPLLFLGAGAGRFIPQPGKWMESVKLIFGFVMLGFSVWILSRIIEPELVLFLWGMLLVAASVFMNLFENRDMSESEIESMLKKLLGILSLIFGIILIVGSIGGATNIKSPLEPYIVKSTTVISSNGVSFKTILAKDMQSTIETSSNPIMFIFTAEWCDNCRALDKDVFSKNDVAMALSGFDTYKIDVTANTEKERALLKKYSLFGPPGILFYDKEKNELASYRLIGYKDKEQFLEHIYSIKKVLY